MAAAAAKNLKQVATKRGYKEALPRNVCKERIAAWVSQTLMISAQSPHGVANNFQDFIYPHFGQVFIHLSVISN